MSYDTTNSIDLRQSTVSFDNIIVTKPSLYAVDVSAVYTNDRSINVWCALTGEKGSCNWYKNDQANAFLPVNERQAKEAAALTRITNFLERTHKYINVR